MMDILNDLLSAVSAGLDTLYPDVPVFAELVPDEIPARCFFVDFAGDPLLDKTVWNRHEVSGKLDITYCSQKTGLREPLSQPAGGLVRRDNRPAERAPAAGRGPGAAHPLQLLCASLPHRQHPAD